MGLLYEALLSKRPKGGIEKLVTDATQRHVLEVHVFSVWNQFAQ